MTDDIITPITAVWGAIAGTAALIMQAAQFFSDESKIVVSASMCYGLDSRFPEGRLFIEVVVRNRGRRIAKVESVEILLPDREDQAVDVVLMKSSTPIFDSKQRGIHVEIGEGDKKVFRYDPFPDEFADLIVQKMKMGNALVTLTSGKEIRASFNPIDPKLCKRNRKE